MLRSVLRYIAVPGIALAGAVICALCAPLSLVWPPANRRAGRVLFGGFPYKPREAVEVEDWYRALYVVKGAPLHVCRAAYRALAEKLHPDRGGNPEDFAAIARAIEEIEKTARTE